MPECVCYRIILEEDAHYAEIPVHPVSPQNKIQEFSSLNPWDTEIVADVEKLRVPAQVHNFTVKTSEVLVPSPRLSAHK